MHPGVNSYRMEADPPRFLYLKDECFLMTDLCDVNISLIMKKSVTLISRSVRRCGVGIEQRKFLDQYLRSRKVSIRPIQSFKRYPLLKTLTKNLSVKFQSL